MIDEKVVSSSIKNTGGLVQSVVWRRQILDLFVKRYDSTYLEAIEKLAALMPYDS